MLLPSHDSAHRVERQMPSLVGDPWTIEVVPRLPPDVADQARALKALQRVRGLAPPHDLLRGLLAYVLGPLATRRLGAWAVLVDLADSAEAAGRKRLRTSHPWRLWLLRALVAAPEVSPPASPCPAGRLWLGAASGLRPPGGTGDAWRRPLAYDVIAGRLSQGPVTDRRGGERRARSRWQATAVSVAERGYGDRRRVAVAVRQPADGVGRLSPATLPLASEAGAPCNVLRGLRHRGGAERAWQGWCRWEGRRSRVRLVAATLDAQTAHAARRRAHRKAQKAGRTLTAPTRTGAGWVLLITTLDAGTGTAAAVVSVSRARWPVALVFKKMQQLLRLNQMRTKHPPSVAATVRALLMGWAWHAGPTTLLRTLLSATAPPAMPVVRRWLLSGLGLDTLRQQVQGRWSEARLQAGLARVRRLVCRRPRRRAHQETTVRAWLEQRAHAHPERQRTVA